MASHFVSSVVSRLFVGKGKDKSTASIPGKLHSTPPSFSSLNYPKLEKLEEIRPRKKKSRSVSCLHGESRSPSGSTELLHRVEHIEADKSAFAQNGRHTQRPVSSYVEISKDFDPLTEESSTISAQKPKPLPRKLKPYTQRPVSCIVESLHQPLMGSDERSQQMSSERNSKQVGEVNCSMSSLPQQASRLYEQKRATYDLKSYFPPAKHVAPKPRPRSMCAVTCNLESEQSTPQLVAVSRTQSTSLLSGSELRDLGSSNPRERSRFADARGHHPIERSQPLPILRSSQHQHRVFASADCLVRVDEGSPDLNVSSPKPTPHIFIQKPRSAHAHSLKQYKSTDMLATVGQPRFDTTSASARPLSCFSDESGYLSNETPTSGGFFGGLSASMGDIYEIFDPDEAAAADDEMSFRRDGSLRKAHSVSSLLRTDSIQDRSLTIMRRRRMRVKSRRQSSGARYSSTETDEGEGEGEGRGSNSASSLVHEDDVSGPKDAEDRAAVAGVWMDGKLLLPSTRGPVTRLHSVQMKAWEIRLRRKQISRRKRSSENLHRLETLV